VVLTRALAEDLGIPFDEDGDPVEIEIGEPVLVDRVEIDYDAMEARNRAEAERIRQTLEVQDDPYPFGNPKHARGYASNVDYAWVRKAKPLGLYLDRANYVRNYVLAMAEVGFDADSDDTREYMRQKAMPLKDKIIEVYEAGLSSPDPRIQVQCANRLYEIMNGKVGTQAPPEAEREVMIVRPLPSVPGIEERAIN